MEIAKTLAQAFPLYGGAVFAGVIGFTIFAKSLTTYTPKSTNSKNWQAMTRSYMKAQNMNPLSLGYQPAYLKKD